VSARNLDIASLTQSGGTALVIHEKADDNKTDPSGNSGARIACGILERR
jgi:Cu-Zn family superoxide dismutase